MNRKDLQALARIRLADARVLLEARRFDGAYYLAGYAVECGLKACIARGTQRHDFPDKKRVDASHTHSLNDLLRVANLVGAHFEKAKSDTVFARHWETLQSWSEHSRYRRHTQTAAEELLAAISDRKHGVMHWLIEHW